MDDFVEQFMRGYRREREYVKEVAGLFLHLSPQGKRLLNRGLWTIHGKLLLIHNLDIWSATGGEQIDFVEQIQRDVVSDLKDEWIILIPCQEVCFQLINGQVSTVTPIGAQTRIEIKEPDEDDEHGDLSDYAELN